MKVKAYVVLALLIALAIPAYAWINGTVSPSSPNNDTIGTVGQNITVSATFTGTANITLQYNNTANATNNGILVVSNGVSGSFTHQWNFSNGSFFDGRYNLTLIVVNSTNSSDNQTIFYRNITVDNTPPTASVIVVAPNATYKGTLYTNATPFFTTTLADALSGLGECWYASNHTATFEMVAVTQYAPSAQCTSPSGTFSDGKVFNATFKAVDKAGNTGANATRLLATVDATSPVITFVTASGQRYADGDSIAVVANVSDTGANVTNGASCGATIDGLTSNFTGSVTYSNVTAQCSGTLTLNTPSGMDDGDYTLELRVADAVGNTATSSIIVTIDNAAPLLPSVNFSSRNPLNDSVNITLNVSVSDGSNVSAVRLTNGSTSYAFTRISGTAADGVYQLNFTLANFGCRNESICSLNITANDTLGNLNNTVSTGSLSQLNTLLFIDSDAPLLLTNATNVSSVDVDGTVRFNATWSDIALLYNWGIWTALEIYNHTTALFVQNQTWPGFPAMQYGNSTNFSYRVPRGLEGQTLIGRIRLNDSQGHTNVTANLTVTVNNVSPTVEGIANHSYAVQNDTIAFNLTDVGAGINLSALVLDVNGSANYTFSYAANASRFNCSATNATNTSETRACEVNAPWPQGNFTLTINTTDLVGNNGTNRVLLYGIAVWPEIVNISINGVRVMNGSENAFSASFSNASRATTFTWDVLSDLTLNSTTVEVLSTPAEQSTFSSLPASVTHNLTAGKNYVRINITMNPTDFTDTAYMRISANIPLNLSAFRSLQLNGVITDFNVSDGADITGTTDYINKTVDIRLALRNASHALPFNATLTYHDVEGLLANWNTTPAFNITQSTNTVGTNDTLILTNNGQTDTFLDQREWLVSLETNLSSANRTFYFSDGESGLRKLLLQCNATPAAAVAFADSCYTGTSNVTFYVPDFGTGDKLIVTEPPSSSLAINDSTSNVTNNSIIDINFTISTPFPLTADLCALNLTIYNLSNLSNITTRAFMEKNVNLSSFDAPADKWQYLESVPAYDGKYNLTLNCTDFYGNTAWSSRNLTVNDTIKPLISDVASANVTRYEATITGTANENVTFSVKYGTVASSLNQSTTQETRSTVAMIELEDLDEGTRYYYNLTACDFKGLCNTSATYNFRTADPSVGGGGGAAGGAAAPKPTDVQGSDSHVIGAVKAGEVVTYKTDLAFSKVSLRFTEDMTGARVTIKQYNATPKNVSPAPGTVYKYLSVEHQGLKTDEHRLELSIDKKWIQSQAIDMESIRLYRYEQQAWKEYKPVHVSTTDTTVVYTVSVPGFSYFAIGGTSTAPAEVPNTQQENYPQQEEVVPADTEQPAEFVQTPREKSGLNIPAWLIITLLAVIVSVGTVVGLKQYHIYKVKEAQRIDQIKAQGAHLRAMDAQLKAQERPQEHDPMWQLHNYIATQRAKGTPDDLIKQRLLSVGWDEFVVSMEMMRR